MNPAEIRTLARTLMDEHGLHDWKVRISSAVRLFGTCTYHTKTIAISGPLGRANGEASVRDTILHEIAHALAGPGAGHGPVWKAICRKIGAEPSRGAHAVAPPSPWMKMCFSCGVAAPAYRRSSKVSACAACCDKYNNGRFSSEYAFGYVSAEDYTLLKSVY